MSIHDTISLPAYVVRIAPSILPTSEAFVVMLQMQNAKIKKDWENAAAWLGYNNTGPLTKMLRGLEEKGFIKISTYRVDWSPLFDMCRKRATGEETIPEIVPPKKKKPRDSNYDLYGEMHEILGDFLIGNIHHWSIKVLPKLLELYSKELILNYCRDALDYFKSKQKDNPMGTYGVYPGNITVKLKSWKDKKERSDFSGI